MRERERERERGREGERESESERERERGRKGEGEGARERERERESLGSDYAGPPSYEPSHRRASSNHRHAQQGGPVATSAGVGSRKPAGSRGLRWPRCSQTRPLLEPEGDEHAWRREDREASRHLVRWPM